MNFRRRRHCNDISNTVAPVSIIDNGAGVARRSENGESFQFNNLNNNDLRRQGGFLIAFNSKICLMSTINSETNRPGNPRIQRRCCNAYVFMKLLNKIKFGGLKSWKSDRIHASKKGGIETVWVLPLIVLAFCIFSFLTSSTLLGQSVYVGNPLNFGGEADSNPPLVILGEYSPAGPSANSLLVPPSGMVQDIKFVGQNYSFTLYALALVSNGSYGMQTFQVMASQYFTNEIPSGIAGGIQTIEVTNFVVDAGDFLAFAGTGPCYSQPATTNGLDATYSTNANVYSATPPGGPGTTFTVGNNGNTNANYQYIPSKGLTFPSRTYAFGVDVLVTNGCYTFITIAGQGTNGAADGLGTNALFKTPQGIAADSNFDLYVSDTGNNRIRKISALGTNWLVTTIAGSPTNGSGSADGAGTNASFYSPEGIAVSGNGTLFVVDSLNNTIRKVTPVGNSWIVSTIAGIVGRAGTNDGSNGVSMFWSPEGIAVDSQTNVYVADTYNDTIRKVTLVNTNWVVTTLAGLAEYPGTADGSNGAARFFLPEGLAVDSADNLYVADSLNNMIRKLTPAGGNWAVTTLAGTNSSGSADGTNDVARFNTPGGIAVDAFNNLYVADTGNNTVRKIIPFGTNWIVSTIGGEPDAPPDNNEGTGPAARFINDKGIVTEGDLISLAGQTTTLGVVTTNVVGPISQGGFTVGVNISPNSANLDGAVWAIAGYPFTTSGRLQHTNTTFGGLTLVFSNIPGWTPPSGSLSTNINAATEGVVFNVSYTPMSPALRLNKANGLWITGTSNTTFEIDWTNSLTTNLAWAPLQVPGLAANVTLYPGTNQMVASWHDLTNATLNVRPAFYRAKWTGQ
jgi:sugar lactone lactonase YvrE